MPDQVILDMTKTYMYEDQEYILTGRTAVKTDDPRDEDSRPQRRSRRGKPSPPRYKKPPDLMVEIQMNPKNKYSDERPIGIDQDERKWVKYSDLYMVFDQLEDNEIAAELIKIDDVDGLDDFNDIVQES